MRYEYTHRHARTQTLKLANMTQPIQVMEMQRTNGLDIQKKKSWPIGLLKKKKNRIDTNRISSWNEEGRSCRIQAKQLITSELFFFFLCQSSFLFIIIFFLLSAALPQEESRTGERERSLFVKPREEEEEGGRQGDIP